MSTPHTPCSAVPDVRLWRVSEHAADAAAHAHLLDEEERERAAAFVRPRDRDGYVVAHVTLRRLLGERLGEAPADVVMTRQPCLGCGGPHGRPSVPGDAVHFSLSHSGDLVMTALADVPVGVDVEAIPGPRTVADVGPALHPAESAELDALAPVHRPAAFGRCWTRKEAYLKATGAGLTEDPSLTYVGTGANPHSPPRWLITDHPAPPAYTAATALLTTPDPSLSTPSPPQRRSSPDPPLPSPSGV